MIKEALSKLKLIDKESMNAWTRDTVYSAIEALEFAQSEIKAHEDAVREVKHENMALRSICDENERFISELIERIA